MKPQRVPATLVTLVVCALVGLGAWTYTSGSASVSGSSATAAPTTTATSGTGKKSKPPATTSPVTIGGPVAPTAATPHAYVTALYRDWQRADRAAASKIADPKVVKSLFSRRWRASDGWVDKGCQAGVGSSLCTFAKPNRRYVFEVRTATAALPILVVRLQKPS